MNTFRPIRIRSQHAPPLPLTSRFDAPARRSRSDLTEGFHAAAAGWWLTRMLMQSRELDGLISDLRIQQRMLTLDRTRPPLRPPCWLEASLSPRLMRSEYDALIQTLSARRAELGRTYLPLMNALANGGPVPSAVTSIIVA